MFSTKRIVISVIALAFTFSAFSYFLLTPTEEGSNTTEESSSVDSEITDSNANEQSYQKYILKQMSASQTDPVEDAFAITVPSIYESNLNTDRVQLEINTDEIEILIGTQLDATGGTFDTLPEYKVLDVGFTDKEIWRIKTMQGYYYTSFFQLNSDTTCLQYSLEEDFLACGTDRIDLENDSGTRSIFISCTELAEGGVEQCDKLVSEELEISLL